VVDIVRYFENHFEIVSANTPELKREAFHIRFEVLSEELWLPGFEPWRHPDRLEHDQYDEYSAQCLLKHKPTGSWVGTVRLVLAAHMDSRMPLPVEAAAGYALERRHLRGVDRRGVAEISRLILTEPFRHRHDNKQLSHQKAIFTDHRHVELPLLGLFAATMQLTVTNGITHWLAAMEPSLQRLLKRHGLEFTPIGPEMNYSGIRRPYFGEVSKVMKRLKQKKPRVWEIICDGGRRYTPPNERQNNK
jgi:N-acyl amino acid synthase of PEP-CTERM/exosortase system